MNWHQQQAARRAYQTRNMPAHVPGLCPTKRPTVTVAAENAHNEHNRTCRHCLNALERLREKAQAKARDYARARYGPQADARTPRLIGPTPSTHQDEPRWQVTIDPDPTRPELSTAIHYQLTP